MSGDLAFLGIAEAAELIRAKKLSPVEYTKVLLGQIERQDSKFNAFITVTPIWLRSRAAEVGRSVSVGARRVSSPLTKASAKETLTTATIASTLPRGNSLSSNVPSVAII